MPQSNQGKLWASSDVAALRQLAKKDTPTRVIAIKLKRSPAAITSKASEQGISLKPPNQSPYGWAEGHPKKAK